jgi:hypothetical protein
MVEEGTSNSKQEKKTQQIGAHNHQCPAMVLEGAFSNVENIKNCTFIFAYKKNVCHTIAHSFLLQKIRRQSALSKNIVLIQFPPNSPNSPTTFSPTIHIYTIQ